jgi:hypothetical protein
VNVRQECLTQAASLRARAMRLLEDRESDLASNGRVAAMAALATSLETAVTRMDFEAVKSDLVVRAPEAGAAEAFVPPEAREAAQDILSGLDDLRVRFNVIWESQEQPVPAEVARKALTLSYEEAGAVEAIAQFVQRLTGV